MYLTSKIVPWHIAQATRAVFTPIVIALNVQAVYWETWHQVWRAAK